MASFVLLCLTACTPHGKTDGPSIYDVAVSSPGGVHFDSRQGIFSYWSPSGRAEVEMVLSDEERLGLWRLIASSEFFRVRDADTVRDADCDGWHLELRAGALRKKVSPSGCSRDGRLDLTIIDSQMRSMFAERPQWRDRPPPFAIITTDRSLLGSPNIVETEPGGAAGP